MNKKTMMWVLILLALGRAAGSETGRGGMAGSFLRMGIGARMLGMGGGSAALADDGLTVYYNPAGLVYLEDRWVTSALHNMALDRSLYYLGFATAIGKQENRKPGMLRGGLGLGWLGAGVSNIDSRDNNGIHQGMLSHNEHCFYFSFALNPDPRFSLGISGKMLYSRFPNLAKDDGAFTSSGFGFDFGLVIRPVRSVSLGVTLRDVRARYTWDSQRVYEQGIQVIDHFPKVFQAGVVWRGLAQKLTAHVDYRQVQGLPGEALAGAEYALMPGFFLRAGVEGSDPAFGFGYRGRLGKYAYQIDYAFAADPVAPSSNHIMTCAFIF